MKDALSGKSKCRNKAIAEAFQYMKIIEGWGTGLPRLFAQCREMGLPEPKFEEFGDGVKVTIYRVKIQKPMSIVPQSATQSTQSTTQSTQSAVPEKANGLTEIEMRIVEAMRENCRISQTRLAELLEVDRNMVKYYIRSLSKKGAVERQGNNRSGRWIVLR